VDSPTEADAMLEDRRRSGADGGTSGRSLIAVIMSVHVRTVPAMGEASGGGAALPHDSMFWFVFGEPVHAASELRAVLPAALADLPDIRSERQ
jgi:hypothetical protein